MAYVVLARKYRPQAFEDVVAQDHVTRTLRHAVVNGRIGSGYLFCGPRGTGKTTVARILAKAVNCANGPTDKPCGVCSSCLEITSGSSLDVLEIDAASNTGVDDVRQLRENIRYLPTGGKKRIYIIDEVHRLSGSAFDALLKTLEEPPPHVIFVFATTEPLKVPDTILSRTQRFDFRRVSVEDLMAHLRKIATSEGLTIDDAALLLLARKADGSVRDSLSLLDQIAAYAGETIGEQDVVKSLGLVDRTFLMDYTAAVAAADRKQVLRLTRSLFENGIDAADFTAELLDHLRTLLIIRTDSDAVSTLSCGAEELAELQKQAQFFEVGDILRLMKILVDLNGDLKSGLDERLLLEVAGVKMAELESTVRLEDILARLNAGESVQLPQPASSKPDQMRGSDFFPPTPPGKAAAPTVAKTVVEPTGLAANLQYAGRNLNLPQVQAGWDSFLALLKQSNPMLASQLRMGEVRAVQDNQIQVMFYSSGEASRQLVLKPESQSIIVRALRDHFRALVTIRFDIDQTKDHPAQAVEKVGQNRIDPRKLVEQSPRLKFLVDKVDGEIIGIKKLPSQE
ncbi:DNA polymerase III subunit gamma/tau [candidate division GN15 bacterium]|uniref:DNA polymerase III subunit gamma/tau n=1 Tax=candidate division GN15 bacterium TaxID=2072418 RepID=A0A855X5R3_9BACT|nr:MAG: DNA polymerase III subunit gamma/tau [candidate division GN15 bacterium]